MDVRLARREYKFLLPPGSDAALIEKLGEFLPVDQNGLDGGYPIISEYYDTERRDAYWERERKIGNRRKLRVRIYGTTDGAIAPTAFLEVKHKRDGEGVKRRVFVPVEALAEADLDLVPLLREVRKGLDNRVKQSWVDEMLRLLEVEGVKPSMQMRYDRVAFESEDGVRVTFDSKLVCRAERKPLRPGAKDFPLKVLPDGYRVMEVKLFGAAPYWMRELTGKYRLQKTPFSKYCTALEMHDDVFHRVSGGHRKDVKKSAALTY